MPAVQHKRASLYNRKNTNGRKIRRTIARRKASIRDKEEAPKVIANSAFTLTLQPKAWASLPHSEADPKEVALYRDLVWAYNKGAELAGVEKIIYKKSNTSTAAISDVLKQFKQTICPPGFEVNIEEHHHRKTNTQRFHFTIYKEASFPCYWHFFEVKHVVRHLKKTNQKLHDFFIVWLRSFIFSCSIPVWFDGPMADSQFILSNYAAELRHMLEKKDLPEVHDALERNGYTEKEMQDRLKAIEETMKVYATGEAQEYMQKLLKTKPVKPHYLLRSLKKFPQQNKIVKFMKHACELMKERVGVMDFGYSRAFGEDVEGVEFEQQIAIIWDWHDHYSGCYARHLEDMSSGMEVFPPVIACHILPSGVYNLDLKNFPQHINWPNKFSALQQEFQKITERFTNYNERDLK